MYPSIQSSEMLSERDPEVHEPLPGFATFRASVAHQSSDRSVVDILISSISASKKFATGSA